MSRQYSRKERYTPWTRRELGKNYIVYDPNWYYANTVYADPAGRNPWMDGQRTWSMDHPGPPFREGGPFDTWRWYDTSLNVSHPGTYRAYKNNSYAYVGGFICMYGPAVAGPVSNMTPQGMGLTDGFGYGDPSPYGPQAWNKYKPGKSIADLSVVLAEAKDIPRMLQTTARGFHDLWKDMRRSFSNERKLADHWLNTQFGWLPFLSDVRKLYRTYTSAERLYQQVKAENGRWVHRGGSVTGSISETVQQTYNNAGCYPQMNVFYYSGSQTGVTKITRCEIERTWFDARFRYWVPNVDSVIWKRNFVRQLYGLTLNPSVVWELTPWSWLIDWFSNVGHCISNVDNGWASNLVSAYAYVMTTRRTEIRVDSEHWINNGCVKDSWTYGYVSKRRAQANPFGFGLTWSDLTPRQWSILGALGITRT